jgi:ubiquinone/menaquinone biosynthesis C-methylase UbiE
MRIVGALKPLKDKHAVLLNLHEHSPVMLELGCGRRKRYAGSIGIDAIDYGSVDIVADAFEALGEFPDASVDFITSSHFIEHVTDLGRFVDEMARVVKPGGRIEVVVPHFTHPYFSSDPTHTHRFGLYTFSYFAEDAIMQRRVPDYVRRRTLRLQGVDLFFKSTPPFYVRHVVKRVLGSLFNSCRYMQELYEENFCYIFPCYEIRFMLERVGE